MSPEMPAAIRTSLRALPAVMLVLALIALPPQRGVEGAGALGAAYAGQDPWPVLYPGQVSAYAVRFRNNGSDHWKIGEPTREVRLGVAGDDRSFDALGMNVRWLSPDRIAQPTAQEVHPGEIGTFAFALRAPAKPGTYMLPLRLVIDGVAWLEDQGVYVQITVLDDTGYHAALVSAPGATTLAKNETSTDLVVTLRNTGTRSFVRGDASELRLGVVGDSTAFADLGANWPMASRVAVQSEPEVAPGATATFRFRLTGARLGSYTIALRPVIDGVQWLEDERIRVDVTVREASAPTLVPEIIQDGLSYPWDVAFTPDGRMLVTERNEGMLRIYASGEPRAKLLGVSGAGGAGALEGQIGLNAVTVDPDFVATRWVFTCGITGHAENKYMALNRHVLSDDSRMTLDKRLLLPGAVPAEDLHSCRMRIGPDEKIWMSLGITGVHHGAQDPRRLLGKMLRINKDGSVPADNPIWPGATEPTYVYSIGHRNPQGLAFDPRDGAAIEGEHSPERDDELNILRPGANYGWPIYVGYRRWAGMVPELPGPEFSDPAYGSGVTTLAMSGIGFVTGPQWGSWSGSLFVATLKEMDLRRFERVGDRFYDRGTFLDELYGRLRSATQGPDGALYVTTDNGPGRDMVIRVKPILAGR